MTPPPQSDSDESVVATDAAISKKRLVVKSMDIHYKSFAPGFYNTPSLLSTSKLLPFERNLSTIGKPFYYTEFKLQNNQNDYISVYCRSTDPQKFLFLASPVEIIPPNKGITIGVVTNIELEMNFDDFKNERICILATKVTLEDSSTPGTASNYYAKLIRFWAKERLGFTFPREQEIYLPPFELAHGTKEDQEYEKGLSEYCQKDDTLDAYLLKSFKKTNLLHVPWFLCISLPSSPIGNAIDATLIQALRFVTGTKATENKNMEDDNIPEFTTPSKLNEDEPGDGEVSMDEGWNLKPGGEFFARAIDGFYKKVDRQIRAARRIKRLSRCVNWHTMICAFLLGLIILKMGFICRY